MSDMGARHVIKLLRRAPFLGSQVQQNTINLVKH